GHQASFYSTHFRLPLVIGHPSVLWASFRQQNAPDSTCFPHTLVPAVFFHRFSRIFFFQICLAVTL
ncbi:MAG TPA: hypothetical protein VN664_05335, partial [Burkholderiales bacterium]|nr:hypothetical protein [Burkholderiales bacterium]